MLVNVAGSLTTWWQHCLPRVCPAALAWERRGNVRSNSELNSLVSRLYATSRSYQCPDIIPTFLFTGYPSLPSQISKSRSGRTRLTWVRQRRRGILWRWLWATPNPTEACYTWAPWRRTRQCRWGWRWRKAPSCSLEGGEALERASSWDWATKRCFHFPVQILLFSTCLIIIAKGLPPLPNPQVSKPSDDAEASKTPVTSKAKAPTPSLSFSSSPRSSSSKAKSNKRKAGVLGEAVDELVAKSKEPSAKKKPKKAEKKTLLSFSDDA